jgi:hypothetical protein
MHAQARREPGMSEEMIRVKVGVSMRAVSGSKQEDVVEIPRAEWEAMTDEEREARLNQMAEAAVSNEVDAWAYVEES